jgi:hypothetical protein
MLTFLLIGAARVTRTPDLLITNQLLYRLSYGGAPRFCQGAAAGGTGNFIRAFSFQA